MVDAITWIVAAVYFLIVGYVLVLLTGMARNLARQSDSMKRIADILERERTP